MTINTKFAAGVLLLFVPFCSLKAQNVGIGATPFVPDAESMLDIQSTTKGVLIPRMTDTERMAISPSWGSDLGLLVYQTNNAGTGNEDGYWYWDGYNWSKMNKNSGWNLNGNGGTSPGTDFIGTTDYTDFVLKTYGIERARINAAGDMGLGTASPLTRLTIADKSTSTVNIGSVYPTNYGYVGLNFNGNITTNTYNILSGPSDQSLYFNRTNGYGMYFGENGTDWQMQISSGGNVGIGTTGASSKFYIYNANLTAGATINCSNGSNSSDGLAVIHSGTGNGIYNYTAAAGANGFYGVQGAVWPNLGWFSIGSVAANLNSGIGVIGSARSIGVYGVAMEDGNTTTDQLGGVFYCRTSAGSGWPAAACIGSIVDNVCYKVFGYGIVSTIVNDVNEKPVVMAAPEAPEALFQDFGTGQLNNGITHIAIDPILAKNIKVDATHIMKVFVQLNDNCNGVYVANRTENGFDVIELNNGTSNASFSWSLAANRKNETRGGVTSDYENFRFKRTYNAAFNGVKTDDEELYKTKMSDLQVKSNQEVPLH